MNHHLRPSNILNLRRSLRSYDLNPQIRIMQQLQKARKQYWVLQRPRLYRFPTGLCHWLPNIQHFHPFPLHKHVKNLHRYLMLQNLLEGQLTPLHSMMPLLQNHLIGLHRSYPSMRHCGHRELHNQNHHQWL